MRAGRYIVCGDLLNRNSVYTDKSHYPYKGGTGSRSVVVEDLEGGASSIDATTAHAY